MNRPAIMGIIVTILLGNGYGYCDDVAALRRELNEVKRQLQELKEAGCKPRDGLPKLEISGESYQVRRNGSVQLVLVTKGTIRNSGSGDAKNVVITTDCAGCSTTARNGVWIDASAARKSRKGTVINYLRAGESSDFSYPTALKVAAVSFGGIMRSDATRPSGLKTRIVSFDAVRK